jgi:hypothetical protein
MSKRPSWPALEAVHERFCRRAFEIVTHEEHAPLLFAVLVDEALVIALHTTEGSILALHRIEDAPTRHAVRAPFPQPEDIARWSGRFTLQGDPPVDNVRH